MFVISQPFSSVEISKTNPSVALGKASGTKGFSAEIFHGLPASGGLIRPLFNIVFGEVSPLHPCIDSTYFFLTNRKRSRGNTVRLDDR